MQLLECEEKYKTEWNKFIVENNSECFLQAWEWGEFQEKTGKKVWRLAVMEGGMILALALIVKHQLKYFGNYLYCPRGPVVDKLKNKNEKSKILELLFSEIKIIAQEEKSVFLKVEPATESNYGSRITDYELPRGFRKSNVDIQPKNTLMLDLVKSEEELLAEMKQKTRYNIRLAEKREVAIKNQESRIKNQEEFKKDFDEFWKLTSETSGRDNFKSHDREYYWKMMETLRKNEKDKNALKADLYLAEFNGKIIAANIVLFFGDLCIYLHGASSNADRNVMAPYLLQWKQIHDAKNIGCKKYDFWGITVDGEKESWEGITRFKKGFGGFEKRYVGSMDLVYQNAKYLAYEAIKMAKKKVKF